MSEPELTDHIIAQCRALVRAIEVLLTIEPTNRLERHLARLLLHLYNRRLRGIVEAAPAWVSNDQVLRVHCRGAI